MSIYGWWRAVSCITEGRKCVFKCKTSLRHDSLAADSEMQSRKKGNSSNDALVTQAATNSSCLMRMLFLWISGRGATYSLLLFCTANILSVRSCALLATHACSAP